MAALLLSVNALPDDTAEVPYRPLLEEGKKWWYSASVTDPMSGKTSTFSFGTTLEGDTIFNKKTYKKYVMLPSSGGGTPE